MFYRGWCFQKLESIIRSNLDGENLEIVPINIIDEERLEKRIDRLANKYNVMAIVATVDIDIDYIPFVTAMDILQGDGIEKLKKIIEQENIYSKIGESLQEHITNLDGKEITRDIKYLIRSIEKGLGLEVVSDAKIGIVLHIAFLIDNLLNGVLPRRFDNLEAYSNLYAKEMGIIRRCILLMEKKYGISVEDDELAYILKLFLLNQKVV